MAKVSIDFETYSEVNIKDSGAFRYAEDPSTEPLILAYSLGRGHRPVGVDLTDDWDMVIRLLSPLFDQIAKGADVGAHNAQFERLIWTKTALGRRFPIVPKATQWNCTAARARLLAIPGSLDGAAGALGISTRKDKRGGALIDLFSKPQKKTSKGQTTTWRIMPHERPDDFEDFIQYCEQDVAVEMELDRILPELDSVERAAYDLDYAINDRGMPVNMDRIHAAEEWVAEYSERLMKRAVEISGCRPTQREKTMDFLAAKGFKVEDLTAATVEQLAKKKGLPKDLVELLDLRIELSRAGTKKLKAIQNTVSDDGRIRGGFLFSAASTRRWSSTGVQMHNLQKPEGETNPAAVMDILDGDASGLEDVFARPLTALAQSVRSFFEAPNGRTFGIADYSSVEPRGLAWVAGEEWITRAYHESQDLYKIMGGKVYGKNPSTLTKDGPERFMGKQLILGCGYGMGPLRFVETVAKFGVVISLEESNKAVYGYRDSVPAIIQFWKAVNSACIKATRDWKEVRVGMMRFRPHTLANGYRVLFVDMPSGTICYPNPSVGQQMWNGMPSARFEFWTPLGAKFVKTDTFGGSITENIVQALTRDILRDGLLAADKAGFDLVGHVHDEAIAEIDDGPSAKSDLEEFEQCLTKSSKWARGYPIASEGFISKVYKK